MHKLVTVDKKVKLLERENEDLRRILTNLGINLPENERDQSQGKMSKSFDYPR